MLSEKSLRTKFVLQLASASMMLILIFSVMLYHYIKITVYENAAQSLMFEAKDIIKGGYVDTQNFQIYKDGLEKSDIKTALLDNSYEKTKPSFVKTEESDKTFLTLIYPLQNGKRIELTIDTTVYSQMVDQILADILIINATMIFLIIFYALFLSRTLLMPIKILSKKLSNLNEKVLQHIDENKIPIEFRPLGISINRLIDRIQTFLLYQKELFIGVAHELKTPLAVMKTKNEVTLIKTREPERYIEALKSNNDSINSMNKMISSILEIGRQEGAQFEKATKKDMIAYIEELVKNFRIIARGEEKDISLKLSPNKLFMTIQPTLFLHIIQNFVQNAIKFSPKGANIVVKSRILNENFIIDVIDEGCGIDENIDLFAPFKRFGDKSGAGLGLFLAKGAAQAMNANIEIRNRNDKSGAVASIILPIESTGLEK